MGLSDANGLDFKFEGMTVPTVILGDYTSRVPSLLVERIYTDIILGFDYIERNVEEILQGKRLLFLRGNKKTLIRRNAEGIWSPQIP